MPSTPTCLKQSPAAERVVLEGQLRTRPDQHRLPAPPPVLLLVSGDDQQIATSLGGVLRGLVPHEVARAAALDIEVDRQSVADADRRSEEDAAPVPWTADALVALLTRLDDEAPVQAQAIRLAAQSGGRVTRDLVYEFGGFPEDRMLRGFTGRRRD